MNKNTFKKQLNFMVIDHLRPRKRNIAPSGRILINKTLYEKFVELGATGRYSSNNDLFDFLEIEEKRYFSPTKYSYLKKESFETRVSKIKKISYLDQSLNKREIQSSCYIFWYRFIRYE